MKRLIRASYIPWILFNLYFFPSNIYIFHCPWIFRPFKRVRRSKGSFTATWTKEHWTQPKSHGNIYLFNWIFHLSLYSIDFYFSVNFLPYFFSFALISCFFYHLIFYSMAAQTRTGSQRYRKYATTTKQPTGCTRYSLRDFRSAVALHFCVTPAIFAGACFIDDESSNSVLVSISITLFLFANLRNSVCKRCSVISVVWLLSGFSSSTFSTNHFPRHSTLTITGDPRLNFP